jgi:3-deoxy-7-phosphoheptulonate synthase
MTVSTDNLHIEAFDSLESPSSIRAALPLSERAAATVTTGRDAIRQALSGKDRRLLVVTGPCSIHDPEAALDYANRLATLRAQVDETLLLVMRVYFEKPRTTVGWKGLINDPKLDGSCHMNVGLRQARELLRAINELGLPCATEFLDPIVPQYISDLVAWAAIGARTTESQTHREMASGLSMPVGFKNATDGDLQIAIDGMFASQRSHAFLGINAEGTTCVVRTTGNPDVHLVLRGGAKPNFSKPHIAYAKAALEPFDRPRLIMVDCSHGNSEKDHTRQRAPFEQLVALYAGGEEAVLGLMLESNLVAGKQSIGPNMVYGKSVTDACVGWETTEELMRAAHQKLR